MARRTNTPDTPDSPEPKEAIAAPEAPKDPDDVLCYVDRLGPLVMHWNDRPKDKPVGGVVIPVQHRARLEPGLSFCPGAQWAHVRDSPGWRDRAALGALRAVAGQGGDLRSEWEKAKPAVLVGMLAKTFHIPALERLRDLEASLVRPRMDVAAEIDARLAEMGEKVGHHAAKRRARRQVARNKRLG